MEPSRHPASAQLPFLRSQLVTGVWNSWWTQMISTFQVFVPLNSIDHKCVGVLLECRVSSSHQTPATYRKEIRGPGLIVQWKGLSWRIWEVVPARKTQTKIKLCQSLTYCFSVPNQLIRILLLCTIFSIFSCQVDSCSVSVGEGDWCERETGGGKRERSFYLQFL